MTLIEQRRALNFRERAPARHVVRNSAQYRSGQARSRGSRLQIIALKINGSVSGSEGVSSELNVADLAPKFQPFTAQVSAGPQSILDSSVLLHSPDPNSSPGQSTHFGIISCVPGYFLAAGGA